MLGITEITDDCYGSVRLSWQGAGLETRTVRFWPEALYLQGGTQQDPSGCIPRYYRSNPNSTRGYYVVNFFAGGFQGSTWPYVPTIILGLLLPEESTQDSAFIRVQATTIAITNLKAFLLSIRKVLGIKGKIDPALFVVGPTPLEAEE